MFKRNLSRTIFFAFCLSGALSFAQTPKYPRVLEVQGKVWKLSTDSMKTPVKTQEILREKAHLQTEPGATVKIRLDAARELTLMPDSELVIPAISWDSGEAPVLNLKEGSLHWKQGGGLQGAYNTALTSALFEFIAAPGDYVVGLSAKNAVAFLKVFSGELVFSALNAEESVRVQSGQQVQFKGVVEDGEIAYDILLKGRRIPKGRLGPVYGIESGELQKSDLEQKAALAKIAAEKRRLQVMAAQAQASGQICKGPAGQLNQCAWTCLSKIKSKSGACVPTSGQAVSCIRQRCNANGVWAERTELNGDQARAQCKSKVVVATCDY